MSQKSLTISKSAELFDRKYERHKTKDAETRTQTSKGKGKGKEKTRHKKQGHKPKTQRQVLRQARARAKQDTRDKGRHVKIYITQDKGNDSDPRRKKNEGPGQSKTKVERKTKIERKTNARQRPLLTC